MSKVETIEVNGIEVNEDLAAIIEEYKDDSTVTEIRARITLSGFKFSGKEITEALLAFEISSKKKSFNKAFYFYLSEEKRSTEEVKSFILGESEEYGETTDNVVNHLSFYSSIGDLARTIFENLEVTEEEEGEEIPEEG